MENKELILVGDLNYEGNKLDPNPQTHKMQARCSLYQLTQIINEPTRITETTSTLIDLVIITKSEYIASAGLLHLGISDRSFFYAVRRIDSPKTRLTIKELETSNTFLNYIFVLI